jgi:autotransporter-associated beta strand protein
MLTQPHPARKFSGFSFPFFRLLNCFAAVALTIFFAGFALLKTEAAGTWSPVTNTAPGGVALMLMLSDGTVMCQNGGGTGWYRLTPDIHGNYLNGTWSTMASMHDSRRYYGSQVLRDGRVYAAGGEYGTGGGRMEIYNPTNDSWTAPMVVPNGPIDSCTETLPGGNVLQGNAGSDTRVYDVTNNIYSVAITALGGQDEPSWVKLQDGSILTLTGTNSERFVPSLNKWVADAGVPTTLFGYGYEIGAGVLLPNGKVFYIGGTNHTAIYTPWTTNYAGIYTPAGATNWGSWVAGPDIPNNDAAVDAPAAMMINGKILCCMANSTTGFGSGAVYYEYDYQANAFTQISVPNAVSNTVAYGTTMLDLPDGSVLVSGFGSQLYDYMPTGSPLTNGMPGIVSVTTNLDGSYHVTGTLFNGISEGAYYGDDSQMNSDYPVARMTNSSGNTLYCRTYNWSTCNLMTGTNLVTTELALPAGMLAGTYPLVIVANGIASPPFSLTIPGTALPAVKLLMFTNISSSSMAFKWSAIGLSETGYVVQRSTNGVNYSTIATISGTTTTNYTDNTVTPLGQYYYRVLGTNSFGLGLSPVPIFAASLPATPLPSPWQSRDLGAVLGSGASGTNAGAFTVIGAGGGIGADNDQFQFVYQPVVGDVTITARVITSQNTGSNAMAGVMIRNSLGADVAGAMMAFDAGAQASVFEHRADAAGLATYGLKDFGEPEDDDEPVADGDPSAGGNSGIAVTVSQPASVPLWVRLVRSGNTIAGYTSTDGTTWTAQGTITNHLAATVQVGLAVSSGTYNLLNTSTFDNVSVTGTPAAIPPPVAEWKLDETSGTTAEDSIDSFDGVYNNVVLGQPGATPVTGYSASFNGTSANITIPPLNLNSNVLTITAWINRNGSQNSYAGIFFDRESSTANGLHFGTANELRYTWNNSSSTYGVSSGLVPPAGVWTLVALVIEPTRARIYMATNGGALSGWTNNVANSVQGFAGNSCIGQDTTSSSRYFNGLLDEVQFFNQALTPAQLAQMAAMPTIAFSAPVNGQEFAPPANVALTAVAAATNGHTVNLVQFFNNGNLVGQAVTPPYTNTVTNLLAGSYAFSARMFYDSGFVVSSDPVNVTVETAPATPQRVTATAVSSNMIYISWAPSTGADGYILNRGGSPIAALGAATNYFVDASLSAGVGYCYTVTATNQVGNSAASASSCATTPATLTAVTWDATSSSAGAQDGNGSWDGVSSTWWNGSASTGWTDGLTAIFGSGTTTNCTVSVTANITPGGILFNGNSGGNYTLSDGGGSIILTTNSVFTVSASATISALITGTNGLTKAGPGYLLLSDTNNFTGGVIVKAGTLELPQKSGDVTYVVTNGAKLKIGYSTGGGYANTAMTIYGDGTNATTGFYLDGGNKYNVNGGVVVNGAPTVIRQYGSGYATIGIFDINSNPGLSISSAASGSILDANIELVSDGYGMVVTTASGANTTTGDLVVNGPLNVGNLGLYKRGTGSLWLNGAATSGNAAVQLSSGTIYCGADGVLGQYATLNTSSGTTLDLKTTSQTVAGATLAGTLRMGLNKTNTLPNAQITCLGGSMTLGGTLIVTNLGPALALGDNFILFNASTFTGSFSSKTLPTLSAGLQWDTSQLTNNGSITIVGPPVVAVSPATTNFVYGISATLTAVATGTAPLYFQWYDRNTNLISGATNVTYTLTNPVVAASGNYRVIATNLYGKSTNFSAVTVSKAPLTVAANNTNRIYGATNPVFTVSYTNFVNGDTAAVLSGVPSLTTAALTNSPVGNYAITVGAGTLSAANYSFVLSNGTLTVNTAMLAVNANNASRLYGATNPVFTASYTNFVNGDTVAVLSGAPSLTTLAATNSPVGNYAVTAGAGTLSATNYSFSFSNSILTVTAAPLTITANNASKTAGTNLVFAGTEFVSAGLLNGDMVTNVTLASVGATNTAIAGVYAITATNAAGGGLTNYLITYVAGTLTVTNSTTPSVISSGASLGSGGFVLGGSGSPYQPYVLFGTTNLAQPVWQPVVTNKADGGGHFSFTDSQATNFVQRYYRVESQ